MLRNAITPAIKAAIAAGAGLSSISFKARRRQCGPDFCISAFRTGGGRPLLHRLCSVLSRSAALHFVRRHSAARIFSLHSGDLAAEHREVVERIWRNLLHRTGGADWQLVLHAALRRLRDDLFSERGGEVLEEIEREIAFRRWCDEQTCRNANHSHDPWKTKL